MHNIFEEYRKQGYDQTKIRIYAPLSHFTENYCLYNFKHRSDKPEFLIDGSNSTAWANQNINFDEQFFIIDFVKKKVLVASYTVLTLCNPPKEFIVEGSNDNSTWTVISKVDHPMKQDSTNTFNANTIKGYRYLKFSQTSNILSNTSYRMHLSELEIFGAFVKDQLCSCKRFSSNMKCLFFLFLIDK